MKKIIACVTVLLMSTLCFMLPYTASAESTNDTSYNGTSYIEYFSDGSYLEITTVDETPDFSGMSAMSTLSAYSKNGYKYATYKDSSGVALFQYTLYGTFYVNPGVSSTCTANSYGTEIYDSSWSVSSASSSRSGNQAYGSGTFVHKILFITVDTKSISLTLTCDVNGNLS